MPTAAGETKVFMMDNIAQGRTSSIYVTKPIAVGAPIVGIGPRQPINEYIENSIKPAMEAYVFEPNVSETWAALVGLVTTFLTGSWKEGLIPGAAPEKAFSVQCGLGSTMTAEDVLNGNMILVVAILGTDPKGPLQITFIQRMGGEAG